MSISRNKFDDDVIFMCDECGNEIDTHISDFKSALNHIQQSGWINKNENGKEWSHYCPSCCDCLARLIIT